MRARGRAQREELAGGVGGVCAWCRAARAAWGRQCNCCPLPTAPLPPVSPLTDVVWAFSKCGFCHPDLVLVVERAADTLLREAAADRGEVREGG